MPQGPGTYTYMPEGARGNYFETSSENTQRWQFMANAFLPSRHFLGTHDNQLCAARKQLVCGLFHIGYVGQ